MGGPWIEQEWHSNINVQDTSPPKRQSTLRRNIDYLPSEPKRYVDSQPKPKLEEVKHNPEDDLEVVDSLTGAPIAPSGPSLEKSFTSIQSDKTEIIFTPHAEKAEPSSRGTSFTSFESEPLLREDSSQDYPYSQGDFQSLLEQESPLGKLFAQGDLDTQRSEPTGRGSASRPFEQRSILKHEPVGSSQVSDFSSLSFRMQYEISRFRRVAGIDVSYIPPDIATKEEDYGWVYQRLCNLARRSGVRFPAKCSVEAWRLATGNFLDESQRVSASLSGTLTWASPGSQDVFHLQLKPLAVSETCRFERKVGSDRIMVLTLPSMSQAPSHLQQGTKGGVREVVARWLVQTQHRIAGRLWQAFYVDSIGNSRRKIRRRVVYAKDVLGSDEIASFKVWLLAVGELAANGEVRQLEPSREAFFSWHIPISDNVDSADCKTFQRLRLGLSKAVPTVVLQQEEFARLPDVTNGLSGSERKVMNDGCARMSWTLANAIADMLGLSEIPSVFQARICGAKGLWMVDKDVSMASVYPTQMAGRGFCVEVGDSQLKIKPAPHEFRTATEEQMTFEVLDHSVPGSEASLNFQLMTILRDRHVPKEVLQDFLRADNEAFQNGLFEAMNSRERLLEWVSSNRLSSRTRDEIITMGSFPDTLQERVVMLLESGFLPKGNPFLCDSLREFLDLNVKAYIDKMQVKIPLSTYLYCIADPHDILEADEVHVEFSKTWTDPETRKSYIRLDGIEVLVGRNPGLLPSDIQRRKAAWKKELSHFVDVIVFSRKGRVPLADILSGGDYDGDTPWLCWNPKIVQPFQNADVPDNLLAVEDCGIVKVSQPLSNYFCGTTGVPSRENFEQFLLKCFEFNLHEPLLGWNTSEHEKLSYHANSLSSAGAVNLATLSSFLVDSSKQGYLLHENALKKFLKINRGPELPIPAYKDRNKNSGKPDHIIDYLKFDVAIKEKEKMLATFHRRWQREEKGKEKSKDLHLTEPWLQAIRAAKNEEALIPVLEGLEKDLESIRHSWKGQVAKWSFQQQQDELSGMNTNPSRRGGGGSEGNSWKRRVEDAYEKYCAIEPPTHDSTQSDTPAGNVPPPHRYWGLWKEEQERGVEMGHWPLLKASCQYYTYSDWQNTWYLAGKQLCWIKATADAEARAVCMDAYRLLKVDRKAVRRILKAEVEEEEEEEEEIGGGEDEKEE